jgi:hypothetical protein
MKAEDRLRLRSGSFDREAWAQLWDRLPERARRGAAEFVLQKLHALESSGQWSISWHYETNEEREESGAPIFEFDQPNDVITFKGSLRIGNVGETMTDLQRVVSVACLAITDWQALRQVATSQLGENFKEITKHEDQRFAELVRAGNNPCRVIVPASEFLTWCSSNNRPPDAASRDAFAAERLQQELSLYKKQRGGG